MVNKTYKSIFITLDAVPTNQTNDEIFGYEVEYWIIEGGQPAWEKRKVFSVPDVHFNLTGLIVNRRYEIKVRAYNQCGNGPSSEVLWVKTDERSK